MLFTIGMFFFMTCAFGIPTLLALWGALWIVASSDEVHWMPLLLIFVIYAVVLFMMHCLIVSIMVLREAKERKLAKRYTANNIKPALIKPQEQFCAKIINAIQKN